ncbi:MAG: COG2426 family protein [Anaerofustis sp.]|jgi:uncharacterized membrane protein
MTEAINNLFSTLPHWLHVFLISAIPVIELRGAIPYGILLLGMPYWSTLLFSILGSILPAPFILYLGEYILTKLENSKRGGLSKLAKKIRERSMKKSAQIEKYSYWGLILFVGIPLPGTGVWTGCIIAALLKLNPVKSMLCALAGTTLAGIIVTALVEGGVMLIAH